MGCYADNYNTKDIVTKTTNYPGMTIEYCIGYCFNNGYKVAGLQNKYFFKAIKISLYFN